MYGNYLDDAAKIVAEKREENLKFEHARLTAEEKDDLLLKFHPDRIKKQFTELKIGPNKGQQAPIELAEMLQAKPRFSQIQLPTFQIAVIKVKFNHLSSDCCYYFGQKLECGAQK